MTDALQKARALKPSGAMLTAPIIVAIIIFLVAINGWYTVNQGDRALVLRFGEVVKTTEPGFQFKIPFVDKIEKISVRTRKLIFKTDVYSKDIQAASLDISLNYSLNPAYVADIYTRFSTDYEPRVIMPQILAKTKDAFGRQNATDIVRGREALAAEISTELHRHFDSLGIQIESVQIESVTFSEEFERNIEERMKAEVEVERVRQNLEREKILADMVRTKALAEADARRMAADAEAHAIKSIGDAEAHVVRAKGTAVAQNPDLVRLIEAERWNGQLPTHMIPSGTMPIIGVGR